MANQGLEFRYGIRGDRAVQASLSRLSKNVSSLGDKVDNLNRKSRATSGLLSSSTSVLGRIGSVIGGVVGAAVSGVDRAISGVTGLVTGTARTMVGIGQSAARTLTSAARGIADLAVTAGRQTVSLTGSLLRLARTGSIVTAVLGGGIARAAANTVQKTQQVTTALEAAAGSSEGAAREFQFVQQTADELGVTFDDLAQPFSGVANAIVGAGGSLQTARDNFLGLTQAGQALGLSSDQISGTLLAVSQIASKSAVSMEELLQISERLPGGLSLAAKSMGKTTAEFVKFVSTGKQKPKEFLENFGVYLQSRFAAQALKAADDFQSATARLKNAVRSIRSAVGEAGVYDAMKRFVNQIASLVGIVERAGASSFGQLLARGIDGLTNRISRSSIRIAVASAAIAGGAGSMREALTQLNRDTRGAAAGFADLSPTRGAFDNIGFGPFVSNILRARALTISFFESIGNGARAAKYAILAIARGFLTFGSKTLGAGFASAGDSVLAVLNLIAAKVNELTSSGGFDRFGGRLRYVFNFLTSYLYALLTDTKAVVKDTFRMLYASLPFFVRQILSAIAGAARSVFEVISRLGPLFQPIIDVIAKLFGVASVKLGMFKTNAEKVASPFLILSIILNRLVAKGSIDRFAEKGGKKLQKFILFVTAVIKALKLLSKPSKKNDNLVKALFPNAGKYLIDIRDLIFFLVDAIKTMLKAAHSFWEYWGPAVKRGYNALIGFLDKLAPYFGVKNGKELLLLLVFLKLIGVFKILGFLFKSVFKVSFIIAMVVALLRVKGVISAVSAGTLTWQQGLKKIFGIGIGAGINALTGPLFALGQLFFTLTVATLKFGIFLLEVFGGTAVAAVKAFTTGSLAPLTTFFAEIGGRVVAFVNGVISRLGILGQAIKIVFKPFLFVGKLLAQGIYQIFKSLGSKLLQLIVQGLPRVLGYITGGFTGLVARLTAWLVGLGVSAPVAFALAVTAVVAAIIAVAYIFRDDIEAIFKEIGDFLYGALVAIVGTDAADKITGFFKALFAPIRVIWNTIMDTIDSVLNDGFGKTFEKIGKKLSQFGTLIKNKIKKSLGFSVSVEDQKAQDSVSRSVLSRAGYARGGSVWGAGTATSDSIAAWLSNGEYVINAKAASIFRPLLDLINYGGNVGTIMRNAFSRGLPAFARGGPVTMPSFALPAGAVQSGPGGMMQVDLSIDGWRPFGNRRIFAEDPAEQLLETVRKSQRGMVRGGAAQSIRG